MNKFKERFNECLKFSNLSQEEFARKMNMSQSVISNYCTGKRLPSLDTLMLICKILQVSSDYLLGLVD